MTDSTGSLIKTEFDIYTINYNAEGNITSIKQNDIALSTFEYESGLNGKKEIFEYIINKAGEVTHQLFRAGGVINGKPN